MKKIIKIGFAFVALSLIIGGSLCWATGAREEPRGTAAPVAGKAVDTITPPYVWSDPKIDDTSDLPTWTGKQMELIWWWGHGIGNLPAESSPDDVLTPETTRVTGVTIDYENSYSNGDNTFDVKLAMIAGTKDWPHIISNPQLVKPLVDGDVIYDLTELVPRYCPNLMKKIPLDVFENVWNEAGVNGGEEGKIYGIPTGTNTNILGSYADKLMPELDRKKFAAFAPPINVPQSCIKMRDDVVKMLFPNAKTQDEIEALYMKKGAFTREEVFDIPINSKEDFIDMLYKIRDLNLMEGNLPVYATYGGCGLDNYPLGARLFSHLLGIGIGGDCFTFWDKQAQTVKFTFQEPEFIDMWKTFNRLIRDGVIPKESLIDDDTAFKQKMNNGQYAVTYAEWRWPDDSILKQTGKPYRYRKVYTDIPVRTDKFAQNNSIPSVYGVIVICKDKVAREDLPQMLRWIDYQFSDAYAKARYWGPRSAGLFEVVNSKRKIKDPALENALLYNTDLDLQERYYLTSGFFDPGYQVRRIELWAYAADKYAPYMIYEDIVRKKDEANRYFASVMVQTLPLVTTQLPWIWIFPNNIKGVERMWAARTTWENALLRTLTAASDDEFDRLYQDFLRTSERIGLTDDTLAEMDRDFKRQNEKFMNNLLGR